jgi:DNA-binding transcriptional ArsR family regulator
MKNIIMKKSIRPAISNDKLRQSSSNLRALAHPLRLEIMTILDEAGLASVQEIIEILNLEQSLISQHLKILRAAKLVEFSRRGKFVFYGVSYKNVAHSMSVVGSFNKGVSLGELAERETPIASVGS